MELSFLLKQPHLMQTASDHMDSGYIAAVTFTGLVVVFLALILLVAFLYLMGKVFNRKPKSTNGSDATTKKEAKPAAPAATAPTAAPMEDDAVVAAICAAVSMMGAADGTTYAVKSIRPAKNRPAGRPAWYMAGLRDNTTPF